tara:strand:- start:298 stop:444 length:147 start_codon:yes stop_codon:yes gene_type:complete
MLAIRKMFFGGCHKENAFQELSATLKMVFRGLPHRKWFLGACHMENGF